MTGLHEVDPTTYPWIEFMVQECATSTRTVMREALYVIDSVIVQHKLKKSPRLLIIALNAKVAELCSTVK